GPMAYGLRTGSESRRREKASLPRARAEAVVNLVRLDPPLLPKRGLVLTHTRRGVLSDEDVCRWIRLNRLVHRVEKIDVLLVDDQNVLAQAWRDTAQELQIPLSLRTHCEVPPPDVGALRAQNLH